MSALRHRLTRPLALPVNPWWLLWVAGICTSWLLPTHLIPWRAFHADMAMVMALLPAAFWAAAGSRRPGCVPFIACIVLLTGTLPVLQWLGGRISFSGDAWIVTAYLYAFALAIILGGRFETISPGLVARTVFSALMVAALLSAALAAYQLLHLTGLGLLTIEFPYSSTYRPFANLGQSNHLATLLVWGLIATWWFHLHGRVPSWIAVIAALALLGAAAATQSRTAWLEIGALGIAAAIYRKALAPGRHPIALLGLGAFFVVLVLNWGAATQAMEFGPARSISEVSSAGLRLDAWKLFADAISRRPWTGWGWNQISVAQAVVALDHPSLRYTFHSTHNLVLDLVVQNGLPIGLALTTGGAAWLFLKLRRATTASECLLAMAIVVLLIHAMVEFPQNYAYFLLPAGLMIGALESMYPLGPTLRLPRSALISLLCVGTVLAAWIAVEYNIAERSLERVRFERARVGPSRNSQAPNLVMLTQLREFLRFLRLRYTAPASPEQLESMQQVVQAYPSDGNHVVFAVTAAFSGRPDLASETLLRMCKMVPPSRCTEALANWQEMSKTMPALAAVSIPR